MLSATQLAEIGQGAMCKHAEVNGLKGCIMSSDTPDGQVANLPMPPCDAAAEAAWQICGCIDSPI